MKDNIYYVYIYLNPLEDYDCEYKFKSFYVGKGKNKRYKDHINQKFNGSYLKYKELKYLKDNGIEPKIIIIKDNLSEEESFKLEKETILKYGRINNNTGILTNLTDGGEGSSGRICKESTKSIISSKNKNKKLWNKGKTHLDDSRIRYGTSYERNDETIKKCSESAKKRCDDKYVEKFINRMKSDEIVNKRRNSIIERGSLKGKNNPIYGTKRCNETVNKIKSTLSKYIYTIYKDGVIIHDNIDVITDWARENEVSYSTILKSAKENIVISSGKLKGYKFVRKLK